MKKEPTLLLIICSILTLGVYVAYYIERVTNYINSKSNYPDISARLVSAIKVFSYLSVIGLLLGFPYAARGEIESMKTLDLTVDILTETFRSLILVWSFLAIERLNEVLNLEFKNRFKGVFTLLLTVFYINFHMNSIKILND